MAIPLCCSLSTVTVCLVCHERWCQEHWFKKNSHTLDESKLGSCPKTQRPIRWGNNEGTEVHIIDMSHDRDKPIRYTIHE